MEVGALLILAALILVVIMFVARPFFDVPLDRIKSSEIIGEQKSDQEMNYLLFERYDAILARIDELEADYKQGKLTEGLYKTTRTELLLKGTELMHTIQKMEKEYAFSKEQQEIHNYEQHDDQIEEMILEHRKKGQERMIGFCPRCGKPAQKSDVFCARCGNKLDR